MNLLLNLLWFGCGGFLVFFLYLILGLLLCLTIIGIPAGIQCLKLALLSATPFGRKSECQSDLVDTFCTPFNLIWILLGGIILALVHTLLAAILFITIIGMPFAFQHLKLARLALTPFGKQVVHP